MTVLIFDTETNGKPVKYGLPPSYVDNWPRVAQLAWALYDLATWQPIKYGTTLIKPNGWTIPTEQFFIDNGMSTERNEREGIPMEMALVDFVAAIESSDVIVAHNLNSFDYPVIVAEMIRYNAKVGGPKRNRQKVCTMESTVDFCKISFGKDSRPWKQKSYKWPKLEELYFKLFKGKFDGAHDAMADVNACARCFFELVKLGVIKIDNIINTAENETRKSIPAGTPGPEIGHQADQ